VAQPRMTSCISTAPGDEEILDSLYSLACQSVEEGRHEVLVIAQGEGDFSAQREAVGRMVEQGQPVGIAFEPRSDRSTAWRRALSLSRATHLHFIDADTIASPRLVEHLLYAIDAGAAELFVGHVMPRFDALPPAVIDSDHWALFGLRHYGVDARRLGSADRACANNFCVSRSLLDKEMLRESDIGDLIGWEGVREPHVVQGAIAFKHVSKARLTVANTLARARRAGEPPRAVAARFGVVGIVVDELVRTARRGALRLRLALAGRRP
jgi:hypothetical protein